MSPNSQPLIATIYNPQNQSKEALIAGFIARKQKFERIFRDIRDAPMIKPEQHYLIQGVRGMGKTTFLLRIAYEIENTPTLRERLIPIVFNEEEYGISSLADVWERTAQYLEEADPSFSGLLDSISAQYGQSDYEQRALDQLIVVLRQHNKKLLLLIDNIGDLLKKLDDQEAKRLREVLLTVPELRLIGATSVVIEQAYDYSKPFYEFFKVIHLEGLSKEETIDLFLKLGETYHADSIQRIINQQPGRIEAIRRLTGGVIRTMVLLFEILVENDSGSVFRDLNVLLDRVTPLYKHRMDDLPTQQQKIVAALATAWDAASAKELAQVVRLESKVVSAQLKQLINNGVVEKQETPTKNHLYRLEERFFNIWYLMRFGRKTDQRVLWLIRFFETMFEGDTEWMQERIDGHLQAMELGELDPEVALFLTTALSNVIKDENVEDMLTRTTRGYLLKAGRNELAKEIEYSQYEIVSTLIANEHYEGALNILEKFNNKTTNVLSDLAVCYIFLGKTQCTERILVQLLETAGAPKMLITYKNEEKNENDSSEISKISMKLFFGAIIPMLFSMKDSEFRLLTPHSEIELEIAIRYFLAKNSSRKETAKRLIRNYYQSGLSTEKHKYSTTLLKNIIELWNNNFSIESHSNSNPFILSKFDEALNELILSMEDEGYWSLDRINLGQIYLKLLLAKKQYHTAYNYFQQEEWQLKDRFKPLYYATVYFLQDEYPTDYLRMGPELKETVDDILAEVAQMAIDYA